jgi:hypothetical protein
MSWLRRKTRARLPGFDPALAGLDDTAADAAANEWVKIGELAYLCCPPAEAGASSTRTRSWQGWLDLFVSA